MKKWYCVFSSYYDDGKVTAYMIKVYKGEEKPESEFKSLDDCDCYVDWFDSLEKANMYIDVCLNS